MRPIADLFAVIILIDLDFFPMRVRIEGDVEGILPRMDPKTAAGPRRGCKASGLVVASPGTLPGAELAHIAGGDEHHRGPTGVGSLLKIVVHPFAVMNCGGLDRPGISRPADQKILRRPADLMDRVKVVVLR